MANFHVGQKVVCVIAYGGVGILGERAPLENEVYTIRDFSIVDGRPTMRLVEIVNEPRKYRDGFCECSFGCHRFRPVAEKPTSMDIIRAIVLDPSKPIEDDPREPVITPVPEYEQGAML